MAIQSIGSVVNASFIRSFQGLAGSGGPAIGAGAGAAPTIGTGLRLGARTFATAIQNLNATIGVVNVADDTLKKLTALTDKMISVAERGTSLSAGTSTRRGLQSEFEDLVVKFRRIVESSTLNSVEYLTQDGLVSLFQKIGLDKESSEGVAAVFKKFSKNLEDDDLVSEKTKGKRPPEIPTLNRSKVSQVSDASLLPYYTPYVKGAVTPENSVYASAAYSGFEQPVTVDGSGNVTYQPAISQAQNILAVNPSKGDSVGETTGYSLITSGENFTGDNPGGYTQVFLMATDGSVVRQVTNFSDYNIIYSADISTDNKSVIVGFEAGFGLQAEVYTVADIGDPPASATTVESISVAGTSLNVKISDDGQYIAYSAGGSNALTLKAVGGSTDSYLTGGTDIYNGFDFVGSDKIITNRNNTELIAYDFGSSSETVLLSELVTFSVLAPDGRYSTNDGTSTALNIGHLAYITSDNKLTVANFDLNSNTLSTRYRRNLGEGTLLTNGLSLTYQQDQNTSRDRIDVGIVGDFSGLFGDSDVEMYRISESRFASNFSLFSQASSDPSDILDGNVLTRADSYRLLGDLKALKTQMKDNIAALANAREYLANNISLARTAGFAFLDISNAIDGTEDASRVAQMVADEIRRNANGAQAAQVENLRNIATETVGLLS